MTSNPPSTPPLYSCRTVSRRPQSGAW